MALTLYKGFKQTNDVMFYCDRAGTILDVNDAFTRHYGYTRAEAVGQNPRILRSPHTTDEFYRRMWVNILDVKKGYWRGELFNRTKDGREVPVLLTITAVRDDGGQIVGYVSNALDMSEQKAMQSKVAHSEALATLGEMAAVVAHEIRNPLGSIVMAAQQLAEGGLSAQDQSLVLRVLKEEGARLNQTLTNFLSYARPREPQLQPVDLNRMFEDLARTLRSNKDLSKGVKIRLALRKGLSPFPMDSDQINQVAWNVVINAIQAMEGKGTLTLGTGTKPGCGYFSVRDTGPGIPPEDLKKIFKPFHTTKPQGTGLGLAIAERIVKAHGGRIEIDSRPGKGSQLTVLLPAAAEA